MKEKNQVFILTKDLKKIKYFIKYYNIFNMKTNQVINLIIDNRKEKNIFEDDNNFFNSIHYTSDILSKVEHYIDNKEMFYKILDVYGLSIKLLIFLYCKEININKLMLIDDDLFMLKPFDDYFEKYDYVIKRESLSRMSKDVKDGLSNTFSKNIICEMDKKASFINSGTMIFTYKENLKLIEKINLFFNSQYILNILLKSYKQNKDKPLRQIRWRTWCLEQYVHAIIFNEINNIGYFKSDVKLLTSPKNSKHIKKLSRLVHYLPIDKSYFYDEYSKLIDNYISRNSK